MQGGTLLAWSAFQPQTPTTKQTASCRFTACGKAPTPNQFSLREGSNRLSHVNAVAVGILEHEGSRPIVLVLEALTNA
jgi:hypothetical protein